MKRKLVIIGNGMAGARLASDLVGRGGKAQFDITVFGEEPGGGYNRILLSDVLSGAKHADSIVLHPLEWYLEHDIRLLSGQRAVRIDRENRVVEGANGAREEFDVLVIATGSRAYVPPVENMKAPDGSSKTGIFVMRTLADCERIAGYAAKAPCAVVVGGGLLGLEAARGLMQHGADVHIVNRSETLMSQQLDATGAALLQSAIVGMGITVHLNQTSARIEGEESVRGLRFRDGSALGCDMIVFACGITPNVELARDAGLSVERAIVVDDQLRCSSEDEEIYAVGECAEHRRQVYGLVAPVWEQSRVLADVLTGRNPNAAYFGSKTSTKLKVMGIELASMGDPNSREGDEVVQYVESARGRYKKLVIRENQLVGAILLGDTSGGAALQNAFERGQALPQDRAALLFKLAKNRGGAEDSSALPDDALVCRCNGVSAGTLRACVQNGTVDVPMLMSQTRAGTGCGSCKSLLKAFVKA